MLSSVGSTWTPSKISEPIPYLASESAIRAGMPSPLILGSVRMSTRRAPCWAMSKPISSTAPGPNFSGGAPQVKMLSSAGLSLVSAAIAGSHLPGTRTPPAYAHAWPLTPPGAATCRSPQPGAVHGHLRAGGVGDQGGAEQLARGPCAGLGPGQDAPGRLGGDSGRGADAFTGVQLGREGRPAGADDLGPGVGVGSTAVRGRVGDVGHHVGGAAGQPGRLEVTDRPRQHLPLRAAE